MFAGAQVNADPTQCAVVDTNKVQWEPTAQRGVSIKVLERVNDAVKGRETALVKLEPGTTLPTETVSERQKLVFRIKVQIAPQLLQKHLQQVKTGLPGVAWVKLDAQQPWPAALQTQLPE